jgi:nonsense-mediated mRNA decay protein 3
MLTLMTRYISHFRFDLKNTNVNNEHLDNMPADKIPDVVLIKKMYAEKSVRNRRRKWRLKHLEELHKEGGSVGSANQDYTDFLDDLEEDPDLRRNVNIFKDAKKMLAVEESSEDEAIPHITLAEMMDDMAIGKAKVEPQGSME